MIRIFNVYYPAPTLLLLVGEALLVCGSFLLATSWIAGPDSYIALVYENGLLKIACITAFTLLLSYYFDLFEPQRLAASWEIYFRLLLVLSVLCFALAALVYCFPALNIRPHVLVAGISILTLALVPWRSAYEWMVSFPLWRERVYVLGHGERARKVREILGSRRDAGMEVMRAKNPEPLPSAADGGGYAAELRALGSPRLRVHRILVAMEDRRGSLPVQELLQLRLRGVLIEDAGFVLERLLGKLSLDGLNPSSLIFTRGFHARAIHQAGQRLMSIMVSLPALLLCLPILPLVMLAVRLSSPGPILFRQTRVGRGGRLFAVLKFRTMRQDAENGTAVWAAQDDPRVTRVGRFLRKTRLDEIPQLWNVLRGEMNFVGPRPERPEFVSWLAGEIPYYDLRHIIRPGITGWAQVRFRYGASLEETRQKLEYDLYYIKHLSLGLDLLILFETVKTILLRRGAQ